MSLARGCFLLCGALLPLALHGQATLLAEFALKGTLNDNRGGPALVIESSTAGAGQITALGYTFAANQGLSLTNSGFTPTNFSLEFSFSFSSVSGWTKIADFSNLTADAGFYQLNGNLNFFPVIDAGVGDFAPGGTVHVVLTRDGASGTVTGFVNGHQRFSFVDTSGLAVSSAAGNKLFFFIDDTATGQREAAGGTLNYVRVYNGALTATEVSALYAAGAPIAVPEPSTVTLLALGAIGVFVARRRWLG